MKPFGWTIRRGPKPASLKSDQPTAAQRNFSSKAATSSEPLIGVFSFCANTQGAKDKTAKRSIFPLRHFSTAMAKPKQNPAFPRNKLRLFISERRSRKPSRILPLPALPDRPCNTFAQELFPSQIFNRAPYCRAVPRIGALRHHFLRLQGYPPYKLASRLKLAQSKHGALYWYAPVRWFTFLFLSLLRRRSSKKECSA